MKQNETEHAIKFIKDTFQQLLASSLRLRRVTAPLFVKSSSGLNDTLNDQVPIKFNVPFLKEDCEIVQSLAKWKRMKLWEISEKPGYGIYTDMNAVRPNEELDDIHSLYVDQWDWEKVISKEDRCEHTLNLTVRQIWKAIKDTEYVVCEHYGLEPFLPEEIAIIDSDELDWRFNTITHNPKDLEYAACKEYKAVFIQKIGGKNYDGMRAPDYDDWELNGDLLIWYPLLNKPIELSSMGIRVDSESLNSQLEQSGHKEWKKYKYHQMILNNELPLTIGGGIGQSRLCMVLLHKLHIGEVQSSIWPEDIIMKYKENGITLL